MAFRRFNWLSNWLGQPGVRCLLIVVFIKAAFLGLDHLPQFFQGDSNSYLWTAITGWIPNDRSFVYGYMIRGLSYFGYYLRPLLVAQCLASVGTCMLIYYVLRAHLGVSAILATAAACFCALDPMQLFYERMVMTEAFSLFSFALCIAVALRYVAKPRAATLVLLTLLSMWPISLRLTFVLPSIVICLLPPLYLLLVRGLRAEDDKAPAGECGTRWSLWNFNAARYLGHFAVAAVCTLMLNYGYCCLFGKSNYPRYIEENGLFQLAGLAPIIAPEDATDARVAAIIASANQSHLKNRKMFAVNLFLPGEIGDSLRKTLPDPLERSLLTEAVAKNAMRRAPFQVAKLGWDTWLEYFSFDWMKPRVLGDEGADVPFADQQLQFLQQHFKLVITPDWGARPTVTKWMYMHLRGEYYVLLAAPFLGVASLWCGRKKNPVAILLFLICTVGMLGPMCVFTFPVLRYLHPFGFISPILLTVVLDWVLERWRKPALRTMEASGHLHLHPSASSLPDLTRRAG
jgi:hypothetical protein